MKNLDKELETIMNKLMSKQEAKSYRFKLFVKDGEKKSKTVGSAYLKEGQNIYWLRLRMFLETNFFLLPSKDDPTQYLLMTKDASKDPNQKNKFYYNIVGSGRVVSSQGVMELSFDLLDKKVFMNIYPEESTSSISKENR